MNRSVLVWLERALLALAVVSLGWYVMTSVEAYVYQQYENRQLDAVLRSRARLNTADIIVASGAPVLPARAVLPDALIGRLEVPRLRVTVTVREGSDAETLHRAVGHVPGTALPGAPGNVGLAGHRDTFFRRLKNIRSDDELLLVTTDGRFRYRVLETVVVAPRDTWVLDPTPKPALTLVTCYPFHFIGAAPQRFIVRAEQIDAQYARSATQVTNALALPFDTVAAANLKPSRARQAAGRADRAVARKMLRTAERKADGGVKKKKGFWKRLFGIGA